MVYGWIASLNEPISRSSASKLNSKPAEAYRAFAKLPWAKNHVRVVYKYFRPEYEATAIANEVYGYYIAKELGLPVCRSIDICACDKELLVAPSQCVAGRDPQSRWFRGVATSNETPAGLVAFPTSRTLRILINEVRSWPFLHQAAVFDGLVGNRDRNLGNLYRVGSGRFLLIDHADILGGQAWNIETLSEKMRDMTVPNYLAGFIAETGRKEVQDQMMAYAVELSKKRPFNPAQLDINSQLLDDQCGLERGTTDRVFEILADRQARLPEVLFYHLRCGDLFNQPN